MHGVYWLTDYKGSLCSNYVGRKGPTHNFSILIAHILLLQVYQSLRFSGLAEEQAWLKVPARLMSPPTRSSNNLWIIFECSVSKLGVHTACMTEAMTKTIQMWRWIMPTVSTYALLVGKVGSDVVSPLKSPQVCIAGRAHQMNLEAQCHP